MEGMGMGVADFIVTGFPKCGTSALMRLLEQLEDTSVTRMDGRLEAPFLASEAGVLKLRQEAASSGTRLNGHKYASYAFSVPSLKRIAKEFPDSLIIVCVRDVKRALVSWHNMHRKIASVGQPANHFVNASEDTRKFYANCSLS